MGTGLVQGAVAGLQEATRGIIQAREYTERKEDRAYSKEQAAIVAKQQEALYNQKFEAQALELEQLKSSLAKKETYEGFSAYAETNDPKYLNELLKNPTIKSTLPDIVRYDNISPEIDSHIMEPIGLTKELLDKDPTRYVKATNANGTVHVVDMYGAYAKTGYHQVARKEVLDKMKGILDIAKGKADIQSTEIMTKAIGTGNPDEVMKALQLTNPEAFLKGTRGDSGRRDSLQQYMEALTLAGVPDNEKPAYIQKWVQKTTEGVGAVSKETDVTQLSGDREGAKNLYTASAANDPEWSTKARDTQDKILSNLDEKEKAKAYKTIEQLEANHNAASAVERVLKGQIDKVDKDVIQASVDWVRMKVGSEAAQTVANVDFNTQTGMILASYIKAMSGTAASDAEVQRLMGSFLSGNLNDETYIKQSMKSFSNYLRSSNNTMAKGIIDVAPYSVSKYTNLAPKKRSVVPNKADVTDPKSSYYLAPPPPRSNKQGKPGNTTKKSAADFWK